MVIPHPTRPSNYGNNWKPVWKGGDFKVGDPVEYGHKGFTYEYGIVSFVSGEYMSVCIRCGTGTDELPHRAVNVVLSSVTPCRIIEEHEYTKLDAQLRKGCKTNFETASDETSKEGKEHVSHTLRKRIEAYPLEGKSY